MTNGQEPSWLNLTSATIISHDQIFEKNDHLPTFNSRAIESHLHRIPGLSENFLYFNDDWVFTNHICPSDFWTAENGYQGEDLKIHFRLEDRKERSQESSRWKLSTQYMEASIPGHFHSFMLFIMSQKKTQR